MLTYQLCEKGFIDAKVVAVLRNNKILIYSAYHSTIGQKCKALINQTQTFNIESNNSMMQKLKIQNQSNLPNSNAHLLMTDPWASICLCRKLKFLTLLIGLL